MSSQDFARFETAYEYESRNSPNVGKQKKESVDEYYRKLIDFTLTLTDKSRQHIAIARGVNPYAAPSYMLSQMMWIKNNRPFYRVWPGIMDGFLKARLDVPSDSIQLPGEAISIEVHRKHGGFSALASDTRNMFQELKPRERFLLMLVQDRNGIKGETNIAFSLSPETTVEQHLHDLRQQRHVSEDVHERHELMAKVVLCVSMIWQDKRFVDSICLSRDRCKRTEDNADHLQKKAAKRGVLGWDIGRKIDQSPHARRPHFGIRWCGTKSNGLKPVLVPIKGTIVQKKKLSAVPSGWHGEIDDGT